MIKPTEADKRAIRELSKTKYDTWVSAPSMDSLTHILTFEAKNYATISIEELALGVMDNFSKHEPLVLTLSAKNKEIMTNSVKGMFRRINFLDVENGGTGLIQPTFMEIMSNYCFRVRENDHKDLLTSEDKMFFRKYFWCFEQKSQLTYNQMNKAS